jgi:hypothetical protein
MGKTHTDDESPTPQPQPQPDPDPAAHDRAEGVPVKEVPFQPPSEDRPTKR